jgi:hypothetical protein
MKRGRVGKLEPPARGVSIESAQTALKFAVDRALSIQQPVVVRHVRRATRTRPDAEPRQIVRALERQYLAAVSTSGAAVGGAAAAPGVGTGAAVVVSVGEIAFFLEASALLSLAVAEIHGLEIEDLERRRTLLLTVLLGDSGVKVVEKAAARTGAHWGRKVTNQVSMETIRRINSVLGRHFVTKYGTKQGIIVIGRLAPFGIGAAIGGGGNALLGRGVVTGTRRAFGPAPAILPGHLTAEE